MANKRIGDVEGDVIVTGGVLAGLYFFIAKPLLNTLSDSPEDKAMVASLDTADPTTNPFSLQFSPYTAYLQSTWDTTDPTQDLAYWQGIKANYDAGDYGNTLGVGDYAANIAIGAEMINNAFGFWKWSQDITDVQTVFNAVVSQIQVTLMVAYTFANYNTDLLTLLKNGSTARIPILQVRNGLNDTQLAAILRHINTLPVTP